MSPSGLNPTVVRILLVAIAALTGVGLTAVAIQSMIKAADHQGSSIVGGDSSPNLHGTALNPPLPRPNLAVRDTSGSVFDLSDRPPDELTLLFFGYTNCKDICPTTMADLAVARRLIPEALRRRVVVVFVTDDPNRDTPRVLRRWLDRFDPTFVGLVGVRSQARDAEKALYLPASRIHASSVHGDAGPNNRQASNYEVEHSGIVYAFAPDGQTIIYTGGTTPQQYASDFARLLTY